MNQKIKQSTTEAGLSEMPAGDFLRAEYEARIESLNKEKESLENKLAELVRTRDALAPISEAKIKVLGTEKDLALSKGDLSKAGHKEEEIKEVQRHMEDLQGQISQASSRLPEISEERIKIANRVLIELYPAIQAFCFQVVENFVSLFETTYAGLVQFSEETGARLSGYHRKNLIPPPIGETRFLRSRLAKWF